MFHEFINQACVNSPVEEVKSNICGEADKLEAIEGIIDQYCELFSAQQNKEVSAMALSSVPDLISLFQDPQENNIDD